MALHVQIHSNSNNQTITKINYKKRSNKMKTNNNKSIYFNIKKKNFNHSSYNLYRIKNNFNHKINNYANKKVFRKIKMKTNNKFQL